MPREGFQGGGGGFDFAAQGFGAAQVVLCFGVECALEFEIVKPGFAPVLEGGAAAHLAVEPAPGGVDDAGGLIHGLGLVVDKSIKIKVFPPVFEEVLLRPAQSGERRAVRAVCRDLAKDLAAVVDQCLAPEKSRRYQSVAELEAEVERWLAGEPVPARMMSPGYWLGKKIRRHWLEVAS